MIRLVAVSVVAVLSADCTQRYVVPNTAEGQACATQCREAFTARLKPKDAQKTYEDCIRTCPGAVPEN